MHLSIIITSHNEARNLPILFKELKTVLKKLNKTCQILLIDDGSTDDTQTIIKKFSKKWPQLTGYKFRKNQGKSSALTFGFRQVAGDIVVTMDADLQDNPAELPKLIEQLKHVDVVSGWRTNRQDTLTKKLSSGMFNFIVKKSTGIQLHDFNCGYKAYKREVIENIQVTGGMHRFLPVLAAWQGFKVSEVEISNRPRRFGQSKYGFERALKGFLDLTTIIFLQKYAQRPLRLFGTIGVLAFSGGFLAGLYLTYLKFLGEKIGDRPLLILAVLLMVLGAQFFSLGLIGELLASQKTKGVSLATKI